MRPPEPTDVRPKSDGVTPPEPGPDPHPSSTAAKEYVWAAGAAAFADLALGRLLKTGAPDAAVAGARSILFDRVARLDALHAAVRRACVTALGALALVAAAAAAAPDPAGPEPGFGRPLRALIREKGHAEVILAVGRDWAQSRDWAARTDAEKAAELWVLEAAWLSGAPR